METPRIRKSRASSSDEARRYRQQAHPSKALIGVYDMAEFQALVNKGYLG